tara:strand:+ start:573 stop:1511 length:939 start_codon:yes stop_codon:yes gene_type:complete
MYVEKRKQGKKIKYYLAHSFREGGKIHKTRKYLGIDLNDITLKERKEKAEKLILEEIGLYTIIQDPLKFKLPKGIIEFVEDLEKEEELKVFHLSEKQWEKFSELFTYSTNAIEGSELTTQEVRQLLEKDKWPEKSKEDIAEAYGVDEAINYIRKTGEHISLNLILEIHRIVFKNSKNFAGNFRKKGEEVAVRDGFWNIVHVGAPQSRVVSLLKELIKWYNKNKKKYPALILAAVVHNQFENIHPFADGNGRVGRLLLNNILINNKMPPVNIELKNVSEYYRSLQEYERKHNLKPTIDLLIKEYRILKRKFKK